MVLSLCYWTVCLTDVRGVHTALVNMREKLKCKRLCRKSYIL